MERKYADHHANQLNPNHLAHKQARDNLANQKNPNNPAYTMARAVSEKGIKTK